MSSGWYGSRKRRQQTVLVRVLTGDFGKHTRHPPRKRISRDRKGQAQRPAPTNGYRASTAQANSKSVTTGWRSSVHTNLIVTNSVVYQTNVTARGGVECRVGGTGAESGASRQSRHKLLPATSANTRGIHHASASVETAKGRHRGLPLRMAIGHQQRKRTRKPLPREGAAALPYAELMFRDSAGWADAEARPTEHLLPTVSAHPK